MARKRMIDPGIWTSEDFGTLSDLGQIYFLGIISNADDEGRIKASPAYLKATVRPYGADTLSDVQAAIDEMANRDMLRVYEVDGVRYGCLPNWHKYQTIAKKFPSKLPPYTEHIQDISSIDTEQGMDKLLTSGNYKKTTTSGLSRTDTEQGMDMSVHKRREENIEEEEAPPSPKYLPTETTATDRVIRAFVTAAARPPFNGKTPPEIQAIKTELAGHIERKGEEYVTKKIESLCRDHIKKGDPLTSMAAALWAYREHAKAEASRPKSERLLNA